MTVARKLIRPDLLADAPDMAVPSSDYDLVRRALSFLSDAWIAQPNLEALAGHLNMSPAHCQKVFKRWCGLSPKDFVAALTLDHARQMLDGKASVLEAAHESGLSGAGRLHDLFVSHHAVTPGDYQKRGAGLEISYGFHDSPFGRALVAATSRGLVGLAFVNEDAGDDDEATFEDIRQRWPNACFTSDEVTTSGYLAQVFASTSNDCGAKPDERAIRLVLIGSDFEVRVWETLLKIPTGRAVSYGDIAKHLGKPSAARAVGTAVGRNPISFVVPCHRVLRADGGLGGYHWGITRKRAIIGWEAARLQKIQQ